MNEEGIKSIIGKLMNLAMDPRTPEHEADTARQKAALLMAKHQIDMASVSTIDSMSSDMLEVRTETYYYDSKSVMRWEGYLAANMGHLFDCRCMLTYNYEIEGNDVSFMGHKKDVELVLYFFNYLQGKIASMIKGSYKSKKSQNSYARGMVHNVNERLVEMHKEVEQHLPSDCKDLMVVKGEEVNKFADSIFDPRHTSRARKQGVDWKTFDKGVKDGAKIRLASGLSGAAEREKIA